MPSHSIIGIDLGGTKMTIARYCKETWEKEEGRSLPTLAHRGIEAVLEEILGVMENLMREDTQAVGIGVPGLVLQPEGTVLTMPNIPCPENFPLRQFLCNRLHLPVFVENDANCFTVAEALQGAGKGHHVVVGITLGTGIGGGIVVDGNVFHGSHGFAGEIGHMLLQPGNPPFATEDRRGDVEQFLSGSALGKRCPKAKNPQEYLQGKTCAPLSQEVRRETAWLCANLVHLLDPSIIIFGGSAGSALKSHLRAIAEELGTWVLPGTPLPSLAPAVLEDAGTRGAALLCN